MRVLITTHTYFPNKDGVQFVTQYLAEGLAKKGHNVTVITNNINKELSENEFINGVKVYRIFAKTINTIHKGDKHEFINLLNRLIEENDILVNVCTQCALTDWTLPILNKIKKPKVLYIHSIYDFKYNRENFKNIKSIFSKIWNNIRWKIYYKYNGKHFKQYDSITQLHKMDYSYNFFKLQYGIESEIMENAAENNFFINEGKKCELNLPSNYIINVSNYCDRKNQIKCLELFYKANIPNDWKLIFIGSKQNKYYNKLININEKLRKTSNKKDNVEFLFEVPRHLVPDYVKNACIYFMASKWEAFPISLVETMAAGVPFISSNVGIVKFLPGGVVANSDKEFIYWLEEFANNKEKRKNYGNLGKIEALNKYCVDSKIEKFEKILYKNIEKWSEQNAK